MSDSSTTTQPNRLYESSNPYLHQHAHNPVDWWEWSDEAFDEAKKRDVPVFLSIGYSTCHWCHVMAHESFENQEIAKLLNENFVCIKVDREERPDVDQVYMTALQLETGSGGWPLSAFLDHERRPFFLGTYFPPHDRYGRPGFPAVLEGIAKVWKEQRSDLDEKSASMVTAINSMSERAASDSAPDAEVLKLAYQDLVNRYDSENGGFHSGKNKFPTPHVYEFLLRYFHSTKERKAMTMTGTSLELISYGGIRDHIGGGFHRYSTDPEWRLPHFEKMLYDQAQLASVYLDMYQVTKDLTFVDVVEELFSYVLRDLTNSEGGFYSAEDADSEGEEGKFYVWTKEELNAVLGEDDGAFIASLYSFAEEGNFADEATGHRTGKNIFHFNARSLSSTATLKIAGRDEFKSRVRPMLDKLFFYREGRFRPERDDKIVTSWNGLMIGAFAKAGRTLDNQEYTNAAIAAAKFIEKSLTTEDGRLIRSCCKGDKSVSGFLDDYAFYAQGLIELYWTTFNLDYLERAAQLMDILIADFQDSVNGGFFFAEEKARTLFVNRKDIYDGAEPSGNSVAAMNLVVLGSMLGKAEYLDAANKLFCAFAEDIGRSPSSHTAALCALDALSHGTREVVISLPKDAEIPDKVRNLQQSFAPRTFLILRREEEAERLAKLVPLSKDQGAKDGKPLVYVCENNTCAEPVSLDSFSI